MTVTGKTVAENLKDVKFNPNQKVMRDVANALAPTGGVVGLKGNLAPEGAIVKVAGLKHLKHRGPARVFDCEEDAFAAVQRARLQGRRRARHPLRRAQGRSRHARDAVDHRGAVRAGRREYRADHRRAFLRRHARAVRRPCRARKPPDGGPIGLLKDGDIIAIDAENGTIERRAVRCRTGRTQEGVEAQTAGVQLRRVLRAMPRMSARRAMAP